MSICKKWGLTLSSVMFLTTLAQCQNQTSSAPNSTLPLSNHTSPDEIVPGSLKIRTDNMFESPDLFDGQPFSLKTDPKTGQVDFQTKTEDIQKINEAKEEKESMKTSEIREDIQSRVASADLPLEAREDEYEEVWDGPIKRGDEEVEYYDEEVEAREPIMNQKNQYQQQLQTTTPKEEESFMSLFESLFGGAGEEEKQKTTPAPMSPPIRQPYTTTETARPIITTTTTTRQPQTTSERFSTTTERRVYQQYPERPVQRPYNPYQHVTRAPYPQRPSERPIQRPTLYQRPPERPIPPLKPVHELFEEPSPYRPTQKPVTTETQSTTVKVTQRPYQPTPSRQPVQEVTPNKPESTTHRHTEPVRQTTTKPLQNDWYQVQNNKLDNQLKKENIDRQDTNQNEVVPPTAGSSPDYFNFINLPVHYSTKDTAIPLISTSYANTKVQGMGASKYESNNGKYSNHKYDSSSTTRRPSYWSTKRPSARPTQPPTYKKPVEFSSLEYDDAAIGSSADFGGYGNKAGVKVESTSPKTTPTRTTPTRPPTTTTSSTTRQPITTTRLTVPTTTRTRPPPVREYDEYEYESYPAEVKPVPNPMLTTKKPFDNVPEETKTRYTSPQPKEPEISRSTTPKPREPEISKSTTPKPKEPEYEYYDYDTEPSVSPSTTVKPTTTTTTTTEPSTTSQRYKFRYPSLSKDKIKRPEEKVEVVIPTKVETTSQTTTTIRVAPITTSTTSSNYFQRPTQKQPAPVFEEDENEPPSRTSSRPNENVMIVPARPSTETVVSTTSTRRPEYIQRQPEYTQRQPEIPQRPALAEQPPRQPTSDYTTEFTVGVVQGQNTFGRPPQQQYHPAPPQQGYQGHFVASSIAASPFDIKDEPFRPIAPPAGMSASFQVVGDESLLEKVPEKQAVPFIPPQSTDIHEPHEFIPSTQFHRPGSNQYVVGSSFNAKPQSPFKNQEYYQTPPRPDHQILSTKPKPLKPPQNEYYFGESKPEKQNFIEHSRPILPQKPAQEEVYYKPNPKPVYQKPPESEDYGFFDPKPPKPQNNVELTVDYDFDGIQTEPKPGQYVIFPKPHLSSEISENQQKKTPIPHFHEPPTSTETIEPSSTTTQKQEEIQENASNYPRPHWEKTGKPTYLLNNRNPVPPQMSSNLIPPGTMPPRYRKPVSPNLPPIRNNYNKDPNFPTKPKTSLPNILPQFRPNAKIGSVQRPYRQPPNRRKENFPYRIHNEPDPLMHRDFEVDHEIVPKFITNRGRPPTEYDEMMIQKRMGLPPPPPSPRRVQRTPVTTLQMLQQNGAKKQPTPSTREDQGDPLSPNKPPSFPPLKDDKKQVFVVYPMKTPFNSNIKIEDPDKIDYTFNQTHDQVPLLKPSKRKEKPKPDFPYGFVTPDEKFKGDYTPAKTPTEDVKPNIQDYMPSPVKVLNGDNDRIDMNLHMQSNNQWNQVSSPGEVITQKETTTPAKGNPPTQYHTLMKNTNASEFTLGAIMHTLPDKSHKGQVTSVSVNEESPVPRPGLNVNERISNGKIVTVSMPLDVKEEKDNGFQAPFQASSSAQGNTGWNILEHPEGVTAENVTESAENTTFSFENFTPELIGGFKPIYNTEEPDPELDDSRDSR